MFRSASACLSLLLCAPAALAQLPDPLERALSAPLNDPTPEQIDMRIGTSSARITVRMVEREGQEPEYTLLAPPAEMLTEDQATLWEELLEPDEEEGDGEESGFSAEGFDPAELRRMIGDTATLASEEEGRLIFSFAPQGLPDEDPEAERDPAAARMLENLAGEIHVDAETGHVSSVRLNLMESFKPNFAARIEGFELIQDFVFDEAVNGPRLSHMRFSIAGSAAFQSFDESMVIDILSVSWAQGGAALAPSDLGASAESN